MRVRVLLVLILTSVLITHAQVALGSAGVAESDSIPSLKRSCQKEADLLERVQQTRSDLLLKYLPSASPQVSAEHRADATQPPITVLQQEPQL
ncbi:hypothetical protein ROHU_027991 [Labeo rohita]|uniref:Uncharacterized protein n=1 Tax=Labeo rohita TaxID=84645 RepID=A0A498LY26_LABRO|nr:hypothetical protein ROHU_009704 [Labeo rohita]RXN15582.1 hypothetical protein ROHU_027991 [Labeo rohita]